MDKTSTVQRYRPSAYTEEITEGQAVIWYGKFDNRVSAIAYGGKRKKADWHYTFPTIERFLAHANRWRESIAYRDAERTKRAEERKAFAHTFQVGDILSCSWGYSMTFAEFYQVTAVTAKTITVRKLCAETVSGDGFAGTAVPIHGKFGGDDKSWTKKVTPGYGGKGTISIDRSSASLWDGKPVYFNHCD